MQQHASNTGVLLAGVLLIHGFLGSSREWEALETQLREAGYKTRAVTQLGHGKDPEHRLSAIDADRLLDHCLKEYEAFAAHCGEIYIVGHSMGAVSALWLAGKRVPKLAGVLAFSAPYEHAYGVNYPHGLLRFQKKHLLKALRYMPEFLTGFERPSLRPWWFRKLFLQTDRLLASLRAALPDVETHVWLVHSPCDMAVPYAEMEKIAKRIKRPDRVRMVTLEECGHQVFVTRRSYEMPYQLVFRFLEENRSPVHSVSD